jgi:ABC-type Fe3+/spermidine/putrescine transport system ATPase subunit
LTGISVRGATVLRGGRMVLEDASFSAPEGAVTALLGPAGAGKTTLLATIAGLVKLERGAVLQGGAELGRRKAKGDLAFLPPGSILAPGATLHDALRGIAGREAGAHALAVAARLGLEALLTREVGTLSNGEVLLALTAARLARPAGAMLIDEAGMGLDETGLGALADMLRELAQAGRTVVIATRSPSIAMQADHLVLMLAGQVQQAGAPAQLYHEPKDAACARLTGPANILDGHVRELRAGAYIWSGGARFLQLALADAPRPVLGAPIRLCLRPEHVRLLGASEGADNELDALVIDVANCGAMLRVRLSTTALLLTAHVANVAGVAWPEPGQGVRVGWAAGAAHVLTDARPAGGPAPSPSC